jgi:hypothetical protein
MYAILDDCRELECDIIIRRAEAAIQFLKNGYAKDLECFIFDHDLGGDVTGYDVLKEAFSNAYPLPRHIQLCTGNPVGKLNMQHLLVDNGYMSRNGINFFKKE